MNTTTEGKTRMAARIIRRTLVATLARRRARRPCRPGGAGAGRRRRARADRCSSSPTRPIRSASTTREILRAEGLNEFAVATSGRSARRRSRAYQVVVLAQTDAQRRAGRRRSTTGSSGGGNLIAMRPDAELAGLLGLGADAGDLANGYLQVDTARPGGHHRRDDAVPRHGRPLDARRRDDRSRRSTRARSTADGEPGGDAAQRRLGGGQAAAFTYDLARSVVYTRQGNPAWAGRSATARSTRSARTTCSSASRDQPDWVDLDKVAIPQADEQQRLLAEPRSPR